MSVALVFTTLRYSMTRDGVGAMNQARASRRKESRQRRVKQPDIPIGLEVAIGEHHIAAGVEEHLLVDISDVRMQAQGMGGRDVNHRRFSRGQTLRVRTNRALADGMILLTRYRWLITLRDQGSEPNQKRHMTGDIQGTHPSGMLAITPKDVLPRTSSIGAPPIPVGHSSITNTVSETLPLVPVELPV